MSLPAGCREAATSRQTARINLLAGQKQGFSPRRGDSLHQFTSTLAGPTGTWLRLAVQNLASIAVWEWECGPKISKISTFGKESLRRGDSLDRFRKCLGLYTSNDPTLAFRISCDSHHRLHSYCWETARHSIRLNFSVLPVGKTIRWIKKMMTVFDGLNELYYCTKFGEDCTMRAGCRCENVVFVFFLCLWCSEAGALFVRGVT